VANNVMALFIRNTKTRVWSTTGKLDIGLFDTESNNQGIKITVNAPDGKKHSINIYDEEVEHLQYIIEKYFKHLYKPAATGSGK
jgi:hypothetical protein